MRAEGNVPTGSTHNVFEKQQVPVKVVVEGKELTVGQATLTPGPDGIVHVDMDLKTDAPKDVTDLFSNGITGYSIADEPDEIRPKHKKSDTELQKELGLTPHNHQPKQHRDGKPPWCNVCKLTADYEEAAPRFNFGKPANPLRR